ncbi:MAG: DivIVA domain-containing protein [Actinobacteria bacterium]|nr:DivIVA domain-containing protein [Actinomycetota bacterium]
MTITAKDIQEQGFEHSRRGYDVEEVDVFLERIASEVDLLMRQNQELRMRLAEMNDQPTAVMAPVDNSEIEAYRKKIDFLEEKLAEKGEDAATISAAIISAQKSADGIRSEAKREGEKIYREAEAKAREIIREALTNKQQVLAELERLRDARTQFKGEYLAMIERFGSLGDQEFAKFESEVAEEERTKVETVDVEEGDVAAVLGASRAAVANSSAKTTSPASYQSKYASAADSTAKASAISNFGDTDEFDIEEID